MSAAPREELFAMFREQCEAFRLQSLELEPPDVSESLHEYVNRITHVHGSLYRRAAARRFVDSQSSTGIKAQRAAMKEATQLLARYKLPRHAEAA